MFQNLVEKGFILTKYSVTARSSLFDYWWRLWKSSNRNIMKEKQLMQKKTSLQICAWQHAAAAESRPLSRPSVCPCWGETSPGSTAPSPGSFEDGCRGTGCRWPPCWVWLGRGSPASGRRSAPFPPSWTRRPGSGWGAQAKGSVARYPSVPGQGWYWLDLRREARWIPSVEQKKKIGLKLWFSLKAWTRFHCVRNTSPSRTVHSPVLILLMWTRVVWAMLIILFMLLLRESPILGRLERTGATTRERQRRARRMFILKQKHRQWWNK